MAARRGKSQARRNQSNGLPGWAWLVIGVLVTLLAVLLVPRLLKSEGGDGFFRPKPNPDALPAAISEAGEAIAPDTAPTSGTIAKPVDADNKPKQTQYDFYTLLPGEEVAMSDAELAASARAEAAAQARAARETAAAAAAVAAGADAAALPPPVG
ncbi:MAG: sporulation protein, partial [Thermomonas sp.]